MRYGVVELLARDVLAVGVRYSQFSLPLPPAPPAQKKSGQSATGSPGMFWKAMPRELR